MLKSSKVSLATSASLSESVVEKFNPAEQSHDHKRGRSGRNRNRTHPAAGSTARGVAAPNGPTAERLAKGDELARTPAGHYRAPPVIERLRDRGSLDPNPFINEAMFQAAEKLEGVFIESGLNGGVAAQDLTRVVTHGGDGASHLLPRTEKALHCRQQFRLATKLMGWHEAYPYRGAGRLVVDVVCYGVPVRDAARRHVSESGRDAATQGAGMDRLREGLFALAAHWRMF